MIRKCLALFATLILCQGAGPYFGGDQPVRSDLPLSFDEQWPIGDGISTFSIFLTGDWQIRFLGPYPLNPMWLRWQMFLHANFVFSQASERQYLAHVGDEIGIVGKLGGVPGEHRDLYAIEFGGRGGSDYAIVLAPQQTPIRSLTVLDVQCTIIIRDVELRQTDDIRIPYPSDYCAVKSVAGLRALALAALNREPVATLEWVGEVPANER
jgi:hypothetical protein